MTVDQPDDVYTRPKLDPIDPRKLKLKEVAASERMVGRRLGAEIEGGDLGIDTMQAFLAVTLLRISGARIGDYPAEMAAFEEAGDYELGELVTLFEDEDDGKPPELPPGTPDPTRATQSGGDISADLPVPGSFETPQSSSPSGV